MHILISIHSTRDLSPSNQFLILFGKSGAGNNHIGQLISNLLGYEFFDADTELTQALIQSISLQQPISPDDMAKYYTKLLNTLDQKLSNTSQLVLSIALFLPKQRELFKNKFPFAKLIFIDSDDSSISHHLDLRERSIANSSPSHLNGTIATKSYAQEIAPFFIPPEQGAYPTIINNSFHNADLIQQAKSKLF